MTKARLTQLTGELNNLIRLSRVNVRGEVNRRFDSNRMELDQKLLRDTGFERTELTEKCFLYRELAFDRSISSAEKIQTERM